MDMKKCGLCGEESPRTTEFWHRCSSSADGLQSRCKTCNGKNPGSNKYSTDKEKRARSLVGLALKTGRLVKPEGCEHCGDSPVEYQLEAHHEDYDKPLEVQWLCKPCHVEADKQLRKRLKQQISIPSISVSVQELQWTSR